MKKSFLFGSNAEMVVGWRCGGQAQVGAEAQVGSMVCEKINRMCGTVAPVNPRHHHVILLLIGSNSCH